MDSGKIKFSLKELSDIVIYNLHKIDKRGSDIIPLVEEISNYIDGSSVSFHSDIYKTIINFFNKNDRFPDYEYLVLKFEDLLTKPSIEKFSIDLITDFISELKVNKYTNAISFSLNREDMVNLEKNYQGLMSVNQANVDPVFTSQDAYQSYLSRKNLPKGIMLGIPELDHYMNGLTFGTFNVFAGRPGSGKTTFAVSSVYNSIMNGLNVLVVSLELPRSFFMNRLLSRHSKEMKKPIKNRDIEKNMLTKEQEVVFEEVCDDLYNRKKGELFILGPENISECSPAYFNLMFHRVDGIIKSNFKKDNQELINRNILEGISEEETLSKVGLDMVWIDYIQLMEAYVPNKFDKIDYINTIIRNLVISATTFNGRMLIINTLSQLNRDAEVILNRMGKLETLTHLSEYNRLEREAHTVTIFHSPPEIKRSSEMKGQVLKTRTDEQMIDMVRFFADYAHFEVGSKDYNNVLGQNDGNLGNSLGNISQLLSMTTETDSW
jgi:replicative DNA helicase